MQMEALSPWMRTYDEAHSMAFALQRFSENSQPEGSLKVEISRARCISKIASVASCNHFTRPPTSITTSLRLPYLVPSIADGTQAWRCESLIQFALPLTFKLLPPPHLVWFSFSIFEAPFLVHLRNHYLLHSRTPQIQNGEI